MKSSKPVKRTGEVTGKETVITTHGAKTVSAGTIKKENEERMAKNDPRNAVVTIEETDPNPADSEPKKKS